MPATVPDLAHNPLLATLLAFETVLLLLGCVLLLRRIRSAPARFLGLAPSGLTPSPYHPLEMLLAGLFTVAGVFVVQVIAFQIATRWFPKVDDSPMGMHEVVIGAGLHLGILAGVAHVWFWHLRPSRRAAFASPARGPADAPEPAPATPVPPAVALREAALTFVTVLPIVWLTGFLWSHALKLAGVEAKPQDLVTLFASTGDHRSLVIMIVLAVFIAPVSEELVFRVGLFRWLRTRTLRSVALFAPAACFAALHGNIAVFLPLVALAVCLALAYERVGHPLVPIVAHALFNLNTLALLLAGLNVE